MPQGIVGFAFETEGTELAHVQFFLMFVMNHEQRGFFMGTIFGLIDSIIPLQRPFIVPSIPPQWSPYCVASLWVDCEPDESMGKFIDEFQDEIICLQVFSYRFRPGLQQTNFLWNLKIDFDSISMFDGINQHQHDMDTHTTYMARMSKTTSDAGHMIGG